MTAPAAAKKWNSSGKKKWGNAAENSAANLAKCTGCGRKRIGGVVVRERILPTLHLENRLLCERCGEKHGYFRPDYSREPKLFREAGA